MSYTITSLTDNQLISLADIVGDSKVPEGIRTGTFDSAQQCCKTCMLLIAKVDRAIPDSRRITATEDRESVGTPRKDSDFGQLYWALQRMAVKADREADMEKNAKRLAKLRPGADAGHTEGKQAGVDGFGKSQGRVR